MRMQTAVLCVSVTALLGCAGNGEGLDENGRPIDEGGGGGGGQLTPDFDSIQTNVFTPLCTGCHSGAGAPLGLRLDEGASYALLVNAPSTEVPTLLRVNPGDPDSSYLIQKLEGTAAVGGRMPLGGSPLPATTIATIRQWIAEGAPASGNASPSGASPPVISAAWPLDGTAVKRAPSIVIAASSELDASLLSAGTLKLRRSGGDGDLANGNEVELAATAELRSLSPTIFAITSANDEWLPDTYELRVSGGAPLALASLNAVPIDGDADGTAGGDFVLSFTVEEVK